MMELSAATRIFEYPIPAQAARNSAASPSYPALVYPNKQGFVIGRSRFTSPF
jgi:hypothetical protein